MELAIVAGSPGIMVIRPRERESERARERVEYEGVGGEE
jgi:hypothetical protein